MQSPGENAEGGKELRQQAGEIMACKSGTNSQIYNEKSTYISHHSCSSFPVRVRNSRQTKHTYSDMKANNYEVAEAGETITFRGLVARSTSQAFFLTFCTALGMASLALVLQIQFQDLG
jgi:hypothetical protein